MLGGLLSAHGAGSISILLGEKHEPFFMMFRGKSDGPLLRPAGLLLKSRLLTRAVRRGNPV